MTIVHRNLGAQGSIDHDIILPVIVERINSQKSPMFVAHSEVKTFWGGSKSKRNEGEMDLVIDEKSVLNNNVSHIYELKPAGTSFSVEYAEQLLNYKKHAATEYTPKLGTILENWENRTDILNPIIAIDEVNRKARFYFLYLPKYTDGYAVPGRIEYLAVTIDLDPKKVPVADPIADPAPVTDPIADPAPDTAPDPVLAPLGNPGTEVDHTPEPTPEPVIHDNCLDLQGEYVCNNDPLDVVNAPSDNLVFAFTFYELLSVAGETAVIGGAAVLAAPIIITAPAWLPEAAPLAFPVFQLKFGNP